MDQILVCSFLYGAGFVFIGLALFIAYLQDKLEAKISSEQDTLFDVMQGIAIVIAIVFIIMGFVKLVQIIF